MHVWHCDSDSLSWFGVWFICLFVVVWGGFWFGSCSFLRLLLEFWGCVLLLHLPRSENVWLFTWKASEVSYVRVKKKHSPTVHRSSSFFSAVGLHILFSSEAGKQYINSFTTTIITESWKMSGSFHIDWNLLFPLRKSCNSHQKYCTFLPRKKGMTS